MIIYNTRNWWQSLVLIARTFVSGKNYRHILFGTLLSVIYASLITYLDVYFLKADTFHIDPIFYSLIGFILGLLLVFRLNTAYEKWWEGRKQWGTLINESRVLSTIFYALIPVTEKENRKYLAAQISNFSIALKAHLQDDELKLEDFECNDEILLDILNTSNLPHKIASLILAKTEELVQKFRISEFDKMNIKTQIQSLIHILGSCERIKTTPIPFSHNSFIKSLILIYIGALPFMLVEYFIYFTIPATAILAYAMIGLEIISDEIEQPFGKDNNDLPLNHLSAIIKKDVFEILQVSPDKTPYIQQVKSGILT